MKNPFSLNQFFRHSCYSKTGVLIIIFSFFCNFAKKAVYLRKALLFFIAITAFLYCNATTYYSATGGGNAASTANWWTNNNNTGTNPANFTTPGDVFIVQSNMTTSTAWTVAGTIQENSGGTLTATNTVSVMNMTIAGGTLTLNGGGINITTGGAWAYNSGTFNPGNNNANIVSFGSSTTIGGTLPTTFTFLTINTTNPTDTVKLLTSGATVVVNSGTGGLLTLNKGIFDIGTSNTLNFNTGGGGSPGISNPNATGTSNFATSGTNGSNGGTISYIASGGNSFTVSGTGATTFYNLNFANNATFNNNNIATVINGTLTIPNNNWSMSGDSPIYGANSTLSLTVASAYTPGLEWASSTNPTIGITPGYPNNVIINSGTNNVNVGVGAHGLAGNLTLNGNLNLNGMGASAFTVGGNVQINSGTFTSSSSGDIYVKGNWTRSGGTFAPSGRTVYFIGNGTSSSPQIITGPSGTGENDFNNLSIGSAATGSTYINLTTPVTLASTGTLTLTSGIIQTSSTNLLTVTNTATTAVSGGSSSNYINGPMAWNLAATTTGNYVFPVGSGSSYLPFTLSPNSTSTNTATVQAFNTGSGGHGDGKTVNTISNTEYWSLQTSSNFSNGANISATKPTGISGYNAIAESTTQTGSYSSIGGTVSGNSVVNAGSTGTTSPLYFALANAPFSVETTSVNNPSCDGTTLGSLTVTGSSGTAPYSYKLSGGATTSSNPNTTGTFAGLAAGTYVITATDATSATAYDTIVISPPLSVSGDTTITTCSGSSAQLLASGGTSYSWTPSTGLSSTTIANPVATPTTTTTYYVTSSVNNPNLVQNPGFESGNVDFTTAFEYLTSPAIPYAFAVPNPHGGLYSILGSSTALCTGFTYFTPHSACC